jgi:N-acetylglutamate synthase-like GNAT family acetyltransferase
MVKIRKASAGDRFEISRLTKKFSTTLPREPEEILRLAGNFYVAENEKGRIVGCCGFKAWDSDAEIISLVVDEPYQKKGVARMLLREILGWIKNANNVKKIFALTTEGVAQRIFKPVGFFPAGIQMFSLKVAKDCKRCPKNRLNSKKHYLCDEIALLYKK